ncbi:MAG: transglutaminase-like domain-containing protein [Candidatus Delongbacteria bacterium]|jgi:hypothetical protein|nr:transglutaminase-like domain-containing protein [Candidatus Delongbacteria bacterium]
MRKYPLLISLALLYWGFNTDHLLIASIFMILLESHRFVKFRWDFSTKDFNMISILSTLGTIGYLIFFTNSNQNTGFISAYLKFLPIILFPLNFFYLYSTSEVINAKKLFLLFVVNKYTIVHPYSKKFQPDYIFFASVLIGGSIPKGIFSFPAMILLIVPILYFNKSKNYKFITWIVSLVSVIIIALMLQFSISNTFFFMKDVLTDLYLSYFIKNSDSSLSIGNIGSMKDDFKIELRAEIYNLNQSYYHLKSEVFNSYSNGVWRTSTNGSNKFHQIHVNYEKDNVDSMRIFFFSSGKNNYLKLPFTAGAIAGLSEGQLSINDLGRITLNDPQYLTDYKTFSRNDSIINFNSEPDIDDLKVNILDQTLITAIIDSLGLKELPLNKIYRTLSNYFITDYQYSLDYVEQRNYNKLKNFINAKEGHCELFATLSCLIFRQLGYPSRYVTGYLLSEYNEFEELHVARKKDRHAWIYVNDNVGNWYEFDTTPPDISFNRSESGILSNIYDMMSYMYYKAFMFRKYNNDLFKNILLLSIIPLALFLLYRILRGVQYRGNLKKDRSKSPYKILDELSMIEEKLKNHKLEDHETLSKWFERIRRERRNAFLTEVEREKFDIIQKLYYKKRYFSEGFRQEHDDELQKQIDNIS